MNVSYWSFDFTGRVTLVTLPAVRCVTEGTLSTLQLGLCPTLLPRRMDITLMSDSSLARSLLSDLGLCAQGGLYIHFIF
ncbi:hypothetical protein JZ751_027510 [Albula glossodonta]|uniref:Uncharacterized protein n=1 Tax=Albula glossodonta TaxID=121402 RepID=A0A8T2NC26_9TELE|nr:hypothetical protein JZ751_027510 [Albula glossodonta]